MNSKEPVRARAVGIQSLDEFLNKMDQGAQTLKWDALLVFDRAAANALLTQEYIDRIDIEDVFFPTLPDGVVESGNGIEHVLLGLVLDKPRLSFENATIQDSKGKLQMRLVGGKHLEVIETYRDGEPHRSVSALTVYNAATRGILEMEIDLKAVQGSVDESGKVLLDLKDGLDHLFSGGATGPEKIRLGLYFKKVLDDWSEDDERITQFPLSEMVVDSNSPINPGVFGIRTHAAPGATVLGTENFGEGAVVVFVAMVGSEPGAYPHDDTAMLYMLPDATIPYTSNLVLSQKFMANQAIKAGLDQFQWIKGKFDVEELPGERYKLVANGSAAYGVTYEYYDDGHGGTGQPWRWRLSVNGIRAQLFSKSDELVFEGRKLKARWRSTGKAGEVVYYYETGSTGGRYKNLAINMTVSIDVGYKFVTDTAEGKSLLKFVMDDFNIVTEVEIEDGFGSGEGASAARKSAQNIVADLKAKLASEVEVKARELMDMTFEIDALRLNNLLFRGENVVAPRDVALPTDLTLLGNLAPKRTTMVISPSEPIVASGGIIDFSVPPTGESVTWAVNNLPGETGETGAFKDPSVGRYTAPSDDALHTEGQRRLIVTATSGELVSRALVSVVPSHVTVNPWVAKVDVGQSFALSAGTPDGAALKWDDPELGTVGPDTDPLNPGGYKYTAPVKLPKREPSEPNHYRVLRLDEVTVRPAAGGDPARIDMLVVGAKNRNYWMEPEPRSDGTVALPFYRLDLDGNKVKVPEPIEWTVLRGRGSVDQATQVYTPGADEDDQYVIISAYQVNDDTADRHDYVILPLPFVPVRHYADILNRANKEV
ncbi:hypothetical protein [Pseudomonas sp. NPDC089547]|uniref:hypothetical protein n=1 Tax=Pseudomonas sp. NPDC089547 TaxID=3390652 RepID=UPI003D0835C5